ncbi:unnamed protein product, partial [Meganyctiphanes norvegica]
MKYFFVDAVFLVLMNIQCSWEHSGGWRFIIGTRTKTKITEQQCGVDTNSDSRIVGGEEAEAHEYPWHVAIASIFFPDYTLCGGSLIAERWVMSAAHCFNGLAPLFVVNTIVIRLGLHYQSKNAVDEVRIRAKKLIMHKHYNNLINANDIALIQLPAKVEYCPTIQPVCLPFSDDNQYDNVIAIVTGHGAMAHG